MGGDSINAGMILVSALLLLTACERTTSATNPPFLECNSERTACTSSILEK